MCASAYECMRACLRLYTHVYTYIFEESAREWLKFYEATVPVPVPYTILELGLYIAKADIAIIHTRIMRKVLVFAHSIPFLYIHMYSVRIFAKKKSQRADARAHTHTRCDSYSMHAHTYVCATGIQSRKMDSANVVHCWWCTVHKCVYSIFIFVCKKKRRRYGGESTDKQSRIDSIFLAALYELYDIDKTCTQKHTHQHARNLYAAPYVYI